MKRIAILSISSYVAITSFAFAADDHGAEPYLHGTIAHEVEEGVYEAEHASKGGLPQFEPDWFASEIFWLAIAFAVLYIFFSKKTLPDISGIIENRKNHIQSDIEMAEKLTAEADGVQENYHASLAKAQDKAAKEIKSVEVAMNKAQEEAAEEYRLRSEKELKKAESNIIKAQNEAMDDINNIAAEAASVAVEKIIGSKADVKKVKSIVEGLNNKSSNRAKAA